MQRGFQLQQRYHQHERNRIVGRHSDVALARDIQIQLHDLRRVFPIRRPDLQDEVVIVDLRRMLGMKEGREGGTQTDNDMHQNRTTRGLSW